MKAITRTQRHVLAGAMVALGSGAAAAADLPLKAKPIEYVKICSLYGAGFFYIPGTDTCLRVSGHVRAETYFGARGSHVQSWAIGDGEATRTRNRDMYVSRARGYVGTDTRSSTSLGTLRTYTLLRYQVDTPANLTASTTGVSLDTAIIQWAGFTVGRSNRSYFDSPWVYATKWGNDGFFGNPSTAGGRNVFAYTHQFSKGMSLTLSAEDNKAQKNGNYNGANALTSWGTGAGTDTRGGATIPELIAAFRADFDWVEIHLAGNLINNHVAYNCGQPSGACTDQAGAPSDRMGGGVTGAVKFDLPTGVRDALHIGGTYSVGAIANVFNPIGGSNSEFGLFGRNNVSIVGGYGWDSVYNSGPARVGAGTTVGTVGQQLTTAYGAAAALEHGWNNEWRSSLFGGVQIIDYNNTANAILCSRHVAGGGAGVLSNALTSCNMDYRIVGAGSRTYWTPVKDLQLGVEVLWTNHHSDNAGATYTLPAASGGKPAITYQVRDQNVVSGSFVVRRFF